MLNPIYIIGLVVGTLMVLATAAVILYFWLRRRRNLNRLPEQPLQKQSLHIVSQGATPTTQASPAKNSKEGSEKNEESHDIYVIDDDIDGMEIEGTKKKIELTLDIDQIEKQERKSKKKSVALMSNSEKKKTSHKHYTLAGLESHEIKANSRSTSSETDSAHSKESGPPKGKKSKYGAVKDEDEEFTEDDIPVYSDSRTIKEKPLEEEEPHHQQAPQISDSPQFEE